MSSVKKERFSPSFPIWIILYFFSWQIALARTSITMLYRSSESGYPYLLPDLTEKHLVFHNDDISCVVSLDSLYQVEKLSFYTWFVEYFYHRVLNFIKCICCQMSIELIMLFLSLISLVLYVNWFLHVKPTLNSYILLGHDVWSFLHISLLVFVEVFKFILIRAIGLQFSCDVLSVFITPPFFMFVMPMK